MHDRRQPGARRATAGRPTGPAPGAATGAGRRAAAPAARRRAAPARTCPGTHTPRAASAAPCAAKTAAGEPSATTPPPGSSTTTRSTRSSQPLDPVLDQHAGGAGVGEDRAHCVAQHRRAGGVEHGGGLVQQQQARAQREHAGEREPLPLAAGQAGGRWPRPYGNPTAAQRRLDPRPDLAPAGRARFSSPKATSSPQRASTVWASGSCSSSPVRARPRRRRLAAAARAGTPSRSSSPSWSATRPRRRSPGVEQTGEAGEQGRLAAPARAEQQHPLPGRDVQVEAAHRPGAPAGVPPAPAARPDGDRPDRRRRRAGHTRSAVRPEASGASAPVAASARVSAHAAGPGDHRAGQHGQHDVGELLARRVGGEVEGEVAAGRDGQPAAGAGERARRPARTAGTAAARTRSRRRAPRSRRSRRRRSPTGRRAAPRSARPRSRRTARRRARGRPARRARPGSSQTPLSSAGSGG